jgi:membrane-bound serine protease (ClpP class)
MRWLLGVTLLLVLLAWLATTAVRASGQQPPLLGPESLIGTVGTALTDLAPEGLVEVTGVRWRARAEGPSIAQGSRVRISSRSGLMLIVELADADNAGQVPDADNPGQVQGRPTAGGRSI